MSAQQQLINNKLKIRRSKIIACSPRPGRGSPLGRARETKARQRAGVTPHCACHTRVHAELTSAGPLDSLGRWWLTRKDSSRLVRVRVRVGVRVRVRVD